METTATPEVDSAHLQLRPLPVARSQRSTWRALDHVQAALTGMQFGQVTVVVQDGLIVQVERTEKVRLPKHPPQGG